MVIHWNCLNTNERKLVSRFLCMPTCCSSEIDFPAYQIADFEKNIIHSSMLAKKDFLSIKQFLELREISLPACPYRILLAKNSIFTSFAKSLLDNGKLSESDYQQLISILDRRKVHFDLKPKVFINKKMELEELIFLLRQVDNFADYFRQLINFVPLQEPAL